MWKYILDMCVWWYCVVHKRCTILCNLQVYVIKYKLDLVEHFYSIENVQVSVDLPSLCFDTHYDHIFELYLNLTHECVSSRYMKILMYIRLTNYYYYTQFIWTKLSFMGFSCLLFTSCGVHSLWTFSAETFSNPEVTIWMLQR